MKQTKYRVFDKKGRYQQTYDAVLDGAKDWAVTCAKRTQGKVMEISLVNGKEVGEKEVFSCIDG